ncbi:MAG: site-specific integrase [Prevotella sp.]|nr:site-specific integrase [Prevotella sp.]
MKGTRGKNKNLIEAGNPKLLIRPVKGGTEYCLYLEYHYGYNHENGSSIRKKENLSLRIIASPKKAIDRQRNKETIDLAKRIRYERSQEFLERKEGYRLRKDMSVNFLTYFEAYIKLYQKKDVRVIEMALRDFKKFLTEQYPYFVQRIEPPQMTRPMMEAFAKFLSEHHRGTGVASVYRRFKKVVNRCVSDGLFKESPCKGIIVDSKEDMLVKDILSAEELKTLFDTHYDRENPVVRRAFAMTCFSGIRFCDLKVLTYGDVDYENRVISFRQRKTDGHSKKSGVVIPINDMLLEIIGPKPDDATDDTLIFPLPSMESCLHSLRYWVEQAGIKKHITWHCGRHTFGTQLLANGANIKVVADLLGHSSLKYVNTYVRAVDEQKKKALDSLPKIEL